MDADLSTDEILQVLADPRRRIVLRELAEKPSREVSVDALQEVVARELEGPPPRPRAATKIAIQLRHVHLPRLEEAGLCEYDADGERVEYRSSEFAEALLEFLEERRRPGRVTE